MADNVTFQPITATPIDGTVIATDDCGGAQVQIVKLAISADGSATPLPGDAFNGLLVNLGANNDVTVTSGTVNVGTITGAVALPTGAATSANQTTTNGLLTTIDADTSALAGTVSGSELQVDVLTMPAVTATVSGTVAATQSGTWTVQPGNTANTTAWKVDGSAVTQPISGTVAATQSGTWTVTGAGGTFPVTGTFWQATQPISAAALPLPSGASTLAEQQTQTTSLQLIDDAIATTGSAIPAKGCVASGTDGTNARVLKTDSSGELQVDVLTMPTVTVSGTVAATQSGTWTVQPGNTANTTAWKVDGSAVTQPISAASLPLPSGAATEATLAVQKMPLSVTFLQVTASGDTTLVASGTRKLKRVEASNSHASTALTVGLKVASLNSGAVFGKKYLPAAGGLAVWVFPDDYLQVTSEAITANLSVAGTIEMTAYYE